MGRLTAALLGTTLATGAGCGYLLHAIAQERALARTAAAESRHVPTSRVQEPVVVSESVAPTPPHSPPAPAPAVKKDPLAVEERARRRKVNEWQLTQLIAPASREVELERVRLQYLQRYRRMAQALHLTDQQLEKLAQIAAEYDLRRRERELRRVLGESVDSTDLRQTQQLEIVAALGALKAEELRGYESTSTVRYDVRRMRSELSSANRLTDAQTERLIEVLSDERQQISEELERRREHGIVRIEGAGATAVGYLVVEGEPPVETAEKQITEFHRRLAKRAAEVLTAPQLKLFQSYQEEDVAALRVEFRQRLLR